MIRAGIIGLGIGQKHLEAVNNYRNSKVISVLEKNNKKINYFKKKYKHIKFFNNEKKFYKFGNLNLISIASYDQDHFRQIIEALKNNCHIIVEKPICLSEKQLKKIYQELKKKPRIKFMPNLVLRKNSLFNAMKKKIDLKNVYHIQASYLWGRKEKLFEWRHKTKNFSLTLGATIHILDIICWILDDKPVSVFTKISDKITKNTKFKKFSFANYIFTFPKNIIVSLKSDAVCAHPHYHSLEIFEKHKTFISNLSGQFEITKKGRNNYNVKKKNYAYPDKKNRSKLIQSFIDCILDKKKPPINMQNIFDVMMACLYADLSAKKNKELKIKYLK